jgi:uncharacterized protein YndB with AHSA1/START domain
MKVEARSDNPIGDADVKRVTGKSWETWFKVVDDMDGASIGRRAVTERLVADHGLAAWWAQTVAVDWETARKVHLKDGRPKGYFICVTKTIAAPAERIFDAFGDPRQLSTWLGAGATATFKEGGTFATGDGNRGTYLKLTRPRKLKLTWDDGDPAVVSSIEVILTPKGEKTGFLLNHDRIPTRPLADGLRAAWAGAVDRLKTLLEEKP